MTSISRKKKPEKPEESEYSRLYTTHCKEGAKPVFLGVLAEINGDKAIAYMDDDQIVSYITMLELMDKLYIERKMIAEVDF